MMVRDFEHEIRCLRHGPARDILLYEPTCKRSKPERSVPDRKRGLTKNGHAYDDHTAATPGTWRRSTRWRSAISGLTAKIRRQMSCKACHTMAFVGRRATR